MNLNPYRHPQTGEKAILITFSGDEEYENFIQFMNEASEDIFIEELEQDINEGGTGK